MFKKYYIVGVFLFSLTLIGEDFVHFKPILKIGESWNVKAIKYTSPKATAMLYDKKKFVPQVYTLTYQYQVVNDSKNRYIISIKLIKINREKINKLYEFYQISLDKKDFSLLEIKRIDVETDKVLASQKYKSGSINNITGWISSLPLAFPVFSNKNITKKKDENYYIIKSKKITQQFEYKTYKKNKTIVHMEIFDDQLESRIFQNWEKGKPWWSIAYYTKNGQKFKALLVE